MIFCSAAPATASSTFVGKKMFLVPIRLCTFSNYICSAYLLERSKKMKKIKKTGKNTAWMLSLSICEPFSIIHFFGSFYPRVPFYISILSIRDSRPDFPFNI